MTTNQTIDGVSRKLLNDLLKIESRKCKSAWSATICDELRALLDASPCAHEWTDDGAHLLVCTACGAQEDHDPGWRDMETAPTDGTLVRLLVEFDEHSTEDAEQAITIGANNLDNDEEDVWRFAGWCWTHDHFTEGKGKPVGWLPMLDDPVSKPAAQPQGEPVAWSYCPECGSEEILHQEGDHKQCAECHQEWFSDIDYTDVVRGHLKKLKVEQPAPAAVVLPERKPMHGSYAEGWNACLDEVIRLNTKE